MMVLGVDDSRGLLVLIRPAGVDGVEPGLGGVSSVRDVPELSGTGKQLLVPGTEEMLIGNMALAMFNARSELSRPVMPVKEP